MKIRVISEFYDKFHTATLYKVGTVLDFDDERAKNAISKKLAEPYTEPKPAPKVEVSKVEDNVQEEPEKKEEIPAPEVKPEQPKRGRPAKAEAGEKAEK